MPRLSVNELTELATRALQNAGASPATALAAAKALVAAETEGLASHGVSRVALYAQHLREGRTNGKAKVSIAADKGATCLIDAGGGLAFEASALAVSEAIRRAKQYGAAFCGVTGSHHFGAAAYHLAPVAQARMVGLAFTNSPAAINAWGGRKPLFGTNPIAAVFPRKGRADSLPAEPAARGQRAQALAAASGCPANEVWRGQQPLVIDLSLTEVARGKIMVAAKEGKPIPLGWALDADGKPTTDAKAALTGSMAAIGGAKGAMLALMVELLCVALTGAQFGFENDTFFEPGRPAAIGHAFVAIDPAALAGGDVYFERVETLIKAMLADEDVRLPGARRHKLGDDARANGIEIPDALFKQLRELAG
jgi:(2R)-3-sulfolactate dehydrogenase (NADP+)